MAGGLKPAGGSSFGASWRAEWRFLRRSPWDLAFVTLLPWAMLLAMGWLFTAGAMRELPVVAVDLDGTPDSRLLLRTIDASPGVAIVDQPVTLEHAFSQVRSLHAFAVVGVPRDFTRRLRRGEPIPLIVHYNAGYLAGGQSAMRDIGEAVGAFNARILAERVALQAGPSTLRPAPITVQANILHNPARSYALFLLPLAFAAVLSLVAVLAMTAAIGRELRDGTLAAWLGGRPVPAIAGKLLPYVLLFSAYGLAAVLWVAQAHGGGVAGSLAVLVAGQLLLNLSGAGVALLFAGATRDMGSALSLVGLVIGTSLAFSAATFPVVDAPLFTRAWNALLPLTAYVKLQMQQLLSGAPWPVSLGPLASLAAIAAVAGGLGAWRLCVHARAPRPEAVP